MDFIAPALGGAVKAVLSPHLHLYVLKKIQLRKTFLIFVQYKKKEYLTYALPCVHMNKTQS